MSEHTYPTGLREWRDEEGRLHREDGPALVGEGVELYYLHGVPLTTEEHREQRKVETVSLEATVRGRVSALAQ